MKIENMECTIRAWRAEDTEDLARAPSDKKAQDNLRDGIPYLYTVKDAEEFIAARLSADSRATFAFAVTVGGRVARLQYP